MKDAEWKTMIAQQLECVAVYPRCLRVVDKYTQWLYKRICVVAKRQHWNKTMLLFACIENLRMNGKMDRFLKGIDD